MKLDTDKAKNYLLLTQDSSQPKNETLGEHRRHCVAKPGNCPFEKQQIKQDEVDTLLSRTSNKATYKYPYAPNGKKTNLTHRQYFTVRTPAFKKWFGDWENDPEHASKVVDENGEPLVVWRETRGPQTKPSGKMPFGYPKDAAGEPDGELIRNWMTSDKRVADAYSRKSKHFGYPSEVHSYFLNIRNPNYFDCEGKRYDRLVNGYTVSNELVDEYMGEDGVCLKNINEGDEKFSSNVIADDWLVRDNLENPSARIKSAESNSGNFSHPVDVYDMSM